MSDVAVIVVRKKALRTRGLIDAINRTIDVEWDAKAAPRARKPKQRSAACLWLTNVEDLSDRVDVSTDAADALRGHAFGILRETISPLWRKRRGGSKNGYGFTTLGLSLFASVNTEFCSRYQYSRVGIWKALQLGSQSVPTFRMRPAPVTVTELHEEAFHNNELVFLERAASRSVC